MEQAVRIALMGSLILMALSIASTGFNTARYIVFAAYVPRYIEVPVIIKRKMPPDEAAFLHATATATEPHSSDRTGPSAGDPTE